MTAKSSRGMFTTDALNGLAPKQIEKLARDCEREADRLRAVAAERRTLAEIERAAEDHVRALASLPGLVASYHGPNCPLELAMILAAEAAAVPVETVTYHWRAHCRSEKAAMRRARDLRVLRLKNLGWKNGEIARQVGLAHANSVDRILRRMKG